MGCLDLGYVRGGDEVSNHMIVSGSLALYINPVSVIEKKPYLWGCRYRMGRWGRRAESLGSFLS